MTASYVERAVAGALRTALENLPVVVLTGARQIGKSTLLQRQPGLAERRYVSLDDFANLEAARRNPEALLEGREPLTLDEVQKCPELLTIVKQMVDRDRRLGHFLLSGSANLALLKGVSESLAGRALYLTLHPFTHREMRGAQGRPFLVRFCGEPQLYDTVGTAIESTEVLRGGFPSVCLSPATRPDLWFKGYEQTYLERDIRELSQVSDLMSFRNFLVLTALRTGQLLNVSELARDARLNHATANRWLGLLEASYIVRRVAPYWGNRASRLVKSPKLYLADAGLAAHLAGVKSLAVTSGEPLRGALYETWVAQNLAGLLEAWWSDAQLFYWNVQGRYEVDFVIEDGRDVWAIEVKAASRWNDNDLRGLRAFLETTPHCRAAILAHNGPHAVSLGDRLWALPLATLLS